MVEQGTHKPLVVSSNLTPATNPKRLIHQAFFSCLRSLLESFVGATFLFQSLVSGAKLWPKFVSSGHGGSRLVQNVKNTRLRALSHMVPKCFIDWLKPAILCLSLVREVSNNEKKEDDV